MSSTDSLTACISCRNKKAKCRITAEEYAAGLPCAKCRREMRPCTYTVARHRPRQQKNGINQSHESDEERMSLESQTATASDVNTSPATAVQQDDARDDSQGPVSANLNDAVMTTVVSNGNDTLNLLFEAAQREERGVNGVQVPGLADTHSQQNPTGTSATSLPVLSRELTETWNAYRFVRMGWLSAEEIVWFLDMCDSHCAPSLRCNANAPRFYKNIAPLCPILDNCKCYCTEPALAGRAIY